MGTFNPGVLEFLVDATWKANKLAEQFPPYTKECLANFSAPESEQDMRAWRIQVQSECRHNSLTVIEAQIEKSKNTPTGPLAPDFLFADGYTWREIQILRAQWIKARDQKAQSEAWRNRLVRSRKSQTREKETNER